MSLVVYTGATPNGWKITIMIEELIEAGIDLGRVEIRQLSLSDGDQFTENFTNINPNQKIPAIVHNGTHVFESCAILQYLGETFPTSLFPGDDTRWQVIPWLYWQAANIGTWCWIRSYKWVKVDVTTKPRVVDWLDRVRNRPGVERGISFGVPKAEIDSFSKERRERYLKEGGSIASNSKLKSDI